MATEYTYPCPVRHKGHEVTIYSTPIRGEPAFTIAYHELGKRKRIVRTDEAEAHAEADKIVRRMAGAELKLAPDEANDYRTALESLHGINLTLAEVCSLFAQAWKIAPGKIVEAAAHYAERSTTAVVEGVTLDDAVKEFLKAKEADVSGHYLREYRAKLKQLQGVFVAYPIAKITAPMVDNFLRGLSVSKRTRQNARSTLRTFFYWARSRKYVPSDFDFDETVAEVEAPKHKAVEILKPSELEKLLANAPAELVPFLALQAFAGLRHAEVCRLDWSEINLRRDGEIEVAADIAKEDVRRTVPVLPCLRKWLKPYVKQSGPITPKDDMTKPLRRLATKAGIEWKRNALRKSFISYRVKMVKSLDQTALEAGNSVGIIRKNYLRVAKVKQDARKWFNILPGATAAKNVIALPSKAA